MSMTQALAPHLPYLRRYARALTGGAQSGDAHVRAALTALLAGAQALPEGVSPRVGLYRLFHAIWGTAAERYDDADETIVPGSPPPQPTRASIIDTNSVPEPNVLS